jgi:AAA+ ATPase superfamily predicted ATPase
MKPDTVLNRDREWRRLTSIMASGQPELVFVLGRRRVGKSFLLAQFAREVGGIYYQATERTEAEQLARLSRVVAARFADPALERVGFPDWESLFGYLTVRAGGERLLLVLDEFPYLVAAAPALASIVQAQWDHEWSASRLKIVLSGSHITAMRRLEAGNQPLYGRRTARLVLSPFTYRDAALFLGGRTGRELLLAYGIYGGLPGHLALFRSSRKLLENVSEQMLDPAGRLADEAQHMLDAFLGDAGVHYSIIEAIANGEHTWGGITSRLGKQAGSLSRPMHWLVDMEFVARVVPITERRPENSKRALYRIRDPYVAFWHRFVSPLVSRGALGLVPPERLWEVDVAPGLNDYMGGVFEQVCRDFTQWPGALPFEVHSTGEWWDGASKNQVDVVALGSDGDVLLGECKWGTVTRHDLGTLRRRADLLVPELTGARRIHLALFSAGDLDDAEVRREVRAGRVLHYSANDLFSRGSGRAER